MDGDGGVRAAGWYGLVGDGVQPVRQVRAATVTWGYGLAAPTSVHHAPQGNTTGQHCRKLCISSTALLLLIESVSLDYRDMEPCGLRRAWGDPWVSPAMGLAFMARVSWRRTGAYGMCCLASAACTPA